MRNTEWTGRDGLGMTGTGLGQLFVRKTKLRAGKQDASDSLRTINFFKRSR
jgi:hypothetical protein